MNPVIVASRRALLFGLATLLLADASVAQPVLAWKRTLESFSDSGFGFFFPRDDFADGVSYDGLGNIYLSGSTFGNLAGANAGSSDVFVARYDPDGNQVWIRQFGSTELDNNSGVSADSLGNVFLAGETQGSLGGPELSSLDRYLAKYNPNGDQQWVRQAAPGGGNSVSADGIGNAYVSGSTGQGPGGSDAIVGKYDTFGNQVWMKTSGAAAYDVSRGVSAREGNSVYSTGFISQPVTLEAQDYFLTKYDSTGNVIWTRQVGSSTMDQAIGVAADGLSSVYVCGVTKGLLGDQALGVEDAFVSKFDSVGNLVWTRQIGSNTREFASAVAVGQSGNIYIGGHFAFPESGTLTDSNLFVTKLDPNGIIKWTYQTSDTKLDAIVSLAIDNQGGIYAAGVSRDVPTGNYNAILLKIVEVPEPTSELLSFISVVLLLLRHSRSTAIHFFYGR
jgi:hypothetical protein